MSPWQFWWLKLPVIKWSLMTHFFDGPAATILGDPVACWGCEWTNGSFRNRNRSNPVNIPSSSTFAAWTDEADGCRIAPFSLR